MADNSARIRIGVDGAQSAANELRQLQTQLQSFSSAVQQIANISLAGIGVQQLTSSFKALVDEADNMKDLSDAISINIRELAAWKLAAEQNGTTIDVVAKGVKALSTYMVENADKLKAAGITATDANGALLQLADLFKAMPEGVQRTNLAVEIFKKSGVDMIPMLIQGSAGLQDARDKAQAYADQLETLAPKADAFNDQLSELSVNLKAAGMNAADYFMPGLIGMTQWLNDLAKGGKDARNAVEWLAENSPMAKALLAWHDFANGGAPAGGGSRSASGKIGPKPAAVDELALGAQNEAAIEAQRRADALTASKQKQAKATREAADELKLYNEQQHRTQQLETDVAKTMEANADAVARYAMEQLQQASDGEVAMRDKIQAIQDETAALTLTGAALRNLEVQRALEQSGLQEGTLAWQQYGAEMRAALEQRDDAARNAQAAAANARAWEQTADHIGQSLTDAIFQGGVSAGELLERYFRTLVLRPIIQGVVDSALGVVGMSTGGAGAGGSALSTAGNLASLAGMAGRAGGAMSTAGAWLYGHGATGTGTALGNAGNWMQGGANGGSGFAGGGASVAGWIMLGMMANNALYKQGWRWDNENTIHDPSQTFNTSILKGLGASDSLASMITGNSLQTAIFGTLGIGRGKVKVTGEGITGTIGAGGFDGNAYQAWSQDGGLFHNDRSGTRTSAIAGDLDKTLDASVLSMRSGGLTLAKVLGIRDADVANFSAPLNINLKGLKTDAERQQAIEAGLAGAGGAMIGTLADDAAAPWAQAIIAALSKEFTPEALANAIDLAGRLKPVSDQLVALGVPLASITLSAIDAAGGLDQIQATLAALPDITANAQQAFADADLAGMSTASTYRYLTDQASDLAADFDGSLASAQRLGQVMQNRYQTELELIGQVRDMVRNIKNSVADQNAGFLLDTLDNSGKYNYYDGQMASALDQIRASSDPEEINRWANIYLQAQQKAWDLLSPEQKAANLADFQADGATLDALVTQRGGSITSALGAENAALATAISGAITTALTDLFKPAADTMAGAANTMDRAANTPVTINVRLTDRSIETVSLP